MKASCEWKCSMPSSQAVPKWHGGNVCVQHSEKFCWYLELYETFNSNHVSHSIKVSQRNWTGFLIVAFFNLKKTSSVEEKIIIGFLVLHLAMYSKNMA